MIDSESFRGVNMHKSHSIGRSHILPQPIGYVKAPYAVQKMETNFGAAFAMQVQGALTNRHSGSAA